jgi:hypothetical protein
VDRNELGPDLAQEARGFSSHVHFDLFWSSEDSTLDFSNDQTERSRFWKNKVSKIKDYANVFRFETKFLKFW